MFWKLGSRLMLIAVASAISGVFSLEILGPNDYADFCMVVLVTVGGLWVVGGGSVLIYDILRNK